MRGSDSSGILTEKRRKSCGGSVVVRRADAGLVWAHATLMQSEKNQCRGRKLPSTQTTEIAEKVDAVGRRADTKLHIAPFRYCEGETQL